MRQVSLLDGGVVLPQPRRTSNGSIARQRTEARRRVLALLLLLVAATAEVKGTDAPGTVEPPSVRIISPVHGAVLREHHVSVHAEVTGFDMSLESGCAIVYLNTQRRHKACAAQITVDLADVRDGLSVVDVVLVDESDDELTVMATCSFTVDVAGTRSPPSSSFYDDPRPRANGLVESIYSPATAREIRLLISYATDHMRDAMTRLAASAFSHGGFDGVLLHGPEHIDRKFVAQTASIFAQRKGAGLWIWKPWLINQTLHHRPEGEYVMYVDAALTFVASASPLFDLLAQVREWLTLASDVSLISETEKHDDFLAHRHDQSIFSVLTKKYSIRAHRVPTQYGLDPVEQATFPDDYGQILQAK